MELDQKLLDLEKSIKATEDSIEKATDEYRKAEELGDDRRADRWWDRETQLRDKEKQLREEKACLQNANKRKFSTILPQSELRQGRKSNLPVEQTPCYNRRRPYLAYHTGYRQCCYIVIPVKLDILCPHNFDGPKSQLLDCSLLCR